MTSLGLILPLGSLPSFETESQAASRVKEAVRLAEDGIVDSLWVRDLPVVPPEDDDAGQGDDPWWHLGRLAGACPRQVEMGTASLIIGIRHPLVVSRASTGAQVATGGRFVLGVGTGGKPAMNEALGIARRSLEDFAAQWSQLRQALHGDVIDGAAATSPRPSTVHGPPPMHLATSDIRRWEAIQGDAEGWQTFLTGDREAFEAAHRQVDVVRGAATPTDLRLDVHLVSERDASSGPEFTWPERGRVRCAASQLPDLVRPWLGDPVERLLMRIDGAGAGDALHALRSTWP